MDKPDGDGMKDGRRMLRRAEELLDEGNYRESIEAGILGSELVLGAMLDSWDLAPSDPGCWGRLKTAGRRLPITVTAYLRHCCRRIDRRRALYHRLDEDRAGNIFEEEDAMEMINYAREIVKFAQRHHRRPEGLDDPYAPQSLG
ncbi:MAG: hypothetical protein A2Z06_00470 [Candidatus Glassbacteria bacterium RBG_16_58_8]|uniref:HEPN domain-containing protein n=1 Tax=Candidatus Glassbacteria bacterium RBG_16_58_8 TaxID=1817866 RepID=A0A1F5YAF1_9BACT|nr:MAG: hypothetical protein A2Z06_00470 [Candidatus Glassbacteria bacterium RBG_16_58_8]